MAIIGIVLTIGGIWLVALGGSLYYLITGVAMLASAWFLFRGRMLGALDLRRSVHPQRDLGFRGIAWQRLGDGAVARCAAGDPHLDFACDADANAARAPAYGALHGAGLRLAVIFVDRELRDYREQPAARRSLRCLRRSSPGFVDPSGAATGADWLAYGGTNAAWRFTPLTQINPDNVGKLRKVWEVHVDGQPNNPDYVKLYGTENTPLKAGNMLYTCTAKNVIVALDAATGKPVWRVDPQVPDKWIPYTTACRGVSYYAVPGAAANSRLRQAHHRRHDGFPADRGGCANRQALHRVQRKRAAGHEDRNGLGAAGLRRHQFAAIGHPRDNRRRATRSSTANAAARRQG